MTNFLSTPGPDSLLYSPTQLQANVQREAEKLYDRENTLSYGIESLDSYPNIVPLANGWIRSILARAGHGKSTHAVYLAIREARRLHDMGIEDRCALYWTNDQTVEDIAAMAWADHVLSPSDFVWGRLAPDAVRKALAGKEQLPLWMIGYSVSEERTPPRMTYENVYAAIESMRSKYGVKPSLVVIDYIQNVPIEGRMSRAEAVTEATIRAKELINTLGVKGIICVQAKRELMVETADKIPQAHHCQWADSIAQVSHQIIGQWRPILTESGGKLLSIRVHNPATGHMEERTYPVTQDLFVMQIVKQRSSPA